MRNQKQNKGQNRIVVLLTCVVAVLLAVLIWLLVDRFGTPAPGQADGAGETTAETSGTVQTTEPEVMMPLEIGGIERDGEQMVITTSYGVLKYPFAFSDLLRVEAENTGSGSTLAFSVVIGEETYPVYALHFGGSEGMLLGSVTVDGATASVYAEFAEKPDSLLDADAVTYQAVQETFNDIAASLRENGHFTPAD